MVDGGGVQGTDAGDPGGGRSGDLHAAEALPRWLDVLRRSLDALPTAVELRDGAGEVVHANPAALALFQAAAEPVEGAPTVTVRRPADADAPEATTPTPWGPSQLIDDEGAQLTIGELPVAACLDDGQPHVATVGVRAVDLDAVGGDGAAHRWFRVHAAPSPLPDGATGVLVTYLDITTERHLEEQLRLAELHDPLTRLPNRRLLEARFSQAQASAARAGHHIGLVYLDLDRFRAVNDQHGHGAGDRFLHEFATRLHGVTRAADTAARVGGDEFVVLCTHLDSVLSLQMAAARIVNAVDGTVVLDGRRATVGASVGWVLVGRDMDLDVALNQADTAMYRDRARRSTT